jgi:hypothetical protein
MESFGPTAWVHGHGLVVVPRDVGRGATQLWPVVVGEGWQSGGARRRRGCFPYRLGYTGVNPVLLG